MKLITRKCPNCGASLSFDENDKKVKCEYCKQDIVIEKEPFVDNDEFLLQIEKVASKGLKMQSKMFTIVPIFIVIVAIILIFSIVFTFSRMGQKKNKENDIFNKRKEITSIEQIDEESMKIFHSQSMSLLNEEMVFLPEGTTETEWEYYGTYFLNHKNLATNILFDVYKKTYTLEKENIEVYAAVKYNDVKPVSDGVSSSAPGFVFAPMKHVNGRLDFVVNGYDSIESFYTEKIRTQTDQYTVSTTEGVYKK